MVEVVVSTVILSFCGVAIMTACMSVSTSTVELVKYQQSNMLAINMMNEISALPKWEKSGIKEDDMYDQTVGPYLEDGEDGMLLDRTDLDDKTDYDMYMDGTGVPAVWGFYDRSGVPLSLCKNWQPQRLVRIVDVYKVKLEPQGNYIDVHVTVYETSQSPGEQVVVEEQPVAIIGDDVERPTEGKVYAQLQEMFRY